MYKRFIAETFLRPFLFFLIWYLQLIKRKEDNEVKNFPIDWVIDQDLPDIIKYKTYTGYTIVCPFCGRAKKFDINLAKNLARCNACGKGYNSLTLHALCKTDNKKAYADLWARYKGLDSNMKAQIEKPITTYKETDIAPLWVRSAIYWEFLKSLKLSDEHRQALRNRGLDDETIDSLMYRDVPVEETDIYSVINTVLRENKDVAKYFRRKNIRIAGFYNLSTVKPMAVARKSGILIPVIIKNPHRTDDAINGKWEEENLISGFQIRYDEGDKRYTYYTSLEKESGCGFAGYESIHFRLPDSVIDENTMLFERPKLKRVVLTEGCLKADVASSLSKDMPFIAVLGVNNQRLLDSAFQLLKRKYSTENIILAFDQDYENNKNVEDALNSAKQKILDAGLTYSECYWHEEYKNHNIKGIDDLLLYKRNMRRKDTLK